MPTAPRRLVSSAASAVDSVTSVAASAMAMVKCRVSRRMAALHSGLQHLDRALLVVGLLRDRVGGVQGYLVDQASLIEPGNEDQPFGGLVAAARLQPHA